ncbi:hypothetical protein CEXT_42671, partial [Caerostris extrusa]
MVALSFQMPSELDWFVSRKDEKLSRWLLPESKETIHKKKCEPTKESSISTVLFAVCPYI